MLYPYSNKSWRSKTLGWDFYLSRVLGTLFLSYLTTLYLTCHHNGSVAQSMALLRGSIILHVSEARDFADPTSPLGWSHQPQTKVRSPWLYYSLRVSPLQSILQHGSQSDLPKAWLCFRTQLCKSRRAISCWSHLVQFCNQAFKVSRHSISKSHLQPIRTDSLLIRTLCLLFPTSVPFFTPALKIFPGDKYQDHASLKTHSFPFAVNTVPGKWFVIKKFLCISEYINGAPTVCQVLR